MTHIRTAGRPARRGTVLPMLGVCLIGLFGFVALAVDLGMLAVSRTQSQNGADVAALIGTRTLNNRDGVAFSNLPQAVTAATAAATGNPHMSANLSAGQVRRIETGQFQYDAATQSFRVVNWTTVGGTAGGSPNVTAPGGGSWTALRVTLEVSQPTYFMRVFGVNSMPSGASATAVYRPRDIALVLDMTGSMAFSSVFNSGDAQGSANDNQSMNPDPLVPKVGHYAAVQNRLVATANLANSSNEALPRNNFTITTPGGPPIVRSYYTDPSNMANPATPAFPLTTKPDGSPNLLPAFHRWNPPEAGANPTNYVGPTYTWTGYNPMHRGNETTPRGPTPAPESYGTMTDAAGLTYTGDRWRRRDGRIDKTTTDWASGDNRAAFHAADLLGYTNSNPPNNNRGGNPSFANDWSNFRDPLWEQYGYDLDLVKYRAARGGANNFPLNPATYLLTNGLGLLDNILVPPEDRFQGYSMGPGYWGKTFYIWPPDPREPNMAQPAGGDWRRRFFFARSATAGVALDPQADNDTTNTGANTAVDGVNEVILNTGGSFTVRSNAPVNYAAVLRWLKSGPQVLPPNLRAGRVLYYSSIPDDVNTGSGTPEQRLDKAFWKGYIDYVLASNTGNYAQSGNLYGPADTWAASGVSVTTNDPGQYAFTGYDPLGVGPLGNRRPYMRYTDSPLRPRLHMWFGPLSMMDFLSAINGNWTAGTVYEAQCWQLKAGVNAVLDDVKNNQPNALAGLVYFAADQHNGVRIPLSQNYKRIQNALFYPRNLVDPITAGNVTSEYRPYTNLTNLSGYNAAVIPNASGSTDPATGLAYAFNMLSPGTLADGVAVGTGNGRRGAQKVIIFETDGVPNRYRVPNFRQRGFNSFYTLGGVVNANNGDAVGIGHAHNVIRQIVKPMAVTGTAGDGGPDSGLSLPNAPARVYPIAFGDLFDEVLAPNATFRGQANQFLADCAALGGTGPTGTNKLPDTQIITGPFDQRISRLRDCLERIFQSGVSVVLIE